MGQVDAAGKRHIGQWILPGVLEQCFYYVPIDASAAVVIAAFQKAYEATGKKLYLEKSIALANTMMVAQEAQSGRYPAYWERDERGTSPDGLAARLEMHR